MLPTSPYRVLANPLRLLSCLSLAVALAACGGGGGSPGAAPGTNLPDPTTANPKVVLTLVDGAGKPLTSLSGGETASIKATVTNGASNLPAANEIVKFTGDDTLIKFTPESGSALTDSTGVAVINIKPASMTAAGAANITATTAIGGRTGSSVVNVAIGAAPLTVGTLSFVPPPSGPLPAFSTAALAIPVSSGGAPATSVTGLTMTSLCQGDGLATLVQGSLANGVQSATYTNLGCLRGNDTITVSIGNSTQTISIPVSPAKIGAIQFVGSDLDGSSIVLRGSGGAGRKESAVLTFKVLDQNGKGLAGVDVFFAATTNTGGLSVQPIKGTTDSAGLVTTTVSSGTIPTPVRVRAEATRNGQPVSGLSDTLTVTTGLPVQRSMSLSMDSINIEGLKLDNTVANVTVRLADQYGNPISDSTTVNFVTEGGAIGSSSQGACTTIDGGCTVKLRSQEFRPLNGRLTILAYVQGVEDFTDSNGDGQYSCTNVTDPNGGVPVVYRPLVDICVSGGEPFVDMGDPYIDTGSHAIVYGQPVIKHSLDGKYDPAKQDLPFPYNRTTYDPAGNGKWGINYIRREVEAVFSGSVPRLKRQVCTKPGECRDWTDADGPEFEVKGLNGTACYASGLTFRVYDELNNPMPHKTTVSTANVDKVVPGFMSPSVVPSTNAIGGTYHEIFVEPEDGCSKGVFSIIITPPSGTSYLWRFTSVPP